MTSICQKAVLTHSGSCLSPHLRECLCGTPRSVLDGESYGEDILLAILTEEQVAGAVEVALYITSQEQQ